jgi:hypothetical protein
MAQSPWPFTSHWNVRFRRITPYTGFITEVCTRLFELCTSKEIVEGWTLAADCGLARGRCVRRQRTEYLFPVHFSEFLAAGLAGLKEIGLESHSGARRTFYVGGLSHPEKVSPLDLGRSKVLPQAVSLGAFNIPAR